MEVKKKKNDDKLASILGYAFIILVIGGTIIGLFDIGSLGAIIGIAIAILSAVIIIIMIIEYKI